MLALMLTLALATSPSHADTLSYGYDANGNRISGDGQYYEYNDANRLARIRQGNTSGSIIAEFFYDHTGQRIKKIENGVTTYYIGKHFEANQQGYGTVNTNYYFAGTERVAKKENTGPLSFYHANHLGSTEAISDANGNLVNRTNYFPFGEIKQGSAEKYSFTGKERDVVSGQYYFEARYYASPFKHFTQADTVVPDLYDPQSLNRYSYVVNNPITNIDPTGHEWLKSWTWNLYKQRAKEKLQYSAQKSKEGFQYLTHKGTEITKNILSTAKWSGEKATSILEIKEKIDDKKYGSGALKASSTSVELYKTHEENKLLVESGQVDPRFSKEREVINHLLNFGMKISIGAGEADSLSGGKVKENTLKTIDKVYINRARDVCVAAGEDPGCLD